MGKTSVAPQFTPQGDPTVQLHNLGKLKWRRAVSGRWWFITSKLYLKIVLDFSLTRKHPSEMSENDNATSFSWAWKMSICPGTHQSLGKGWYRIKLSSPYEWEVSAWPCPDPQRQWQVKSQHSSCQRSLICSLVPNTDWLHASGYSSHSLLSGLASSKYASWWCALPGLMR